jgi:hypothetical protein
MTIRRSAAAVGAVALGLFALSACTKPTPLATVTVGSTSVHTEASCYNGGKALGDLSSCMNKTPDQTVKVHTTDKVHIGVDPAIADKGWVVLSPTGQKTDVIKSQTYYTFPTAGSLFIDQQTGQSSKTANLSIVEVSGKGAAAGVWNVKLELAD